MSPFGGASADVFAILAFTLLLASASVSDVRSRRIPNTIVLALFVSGIGYALATMTPLVALEHALGGSTLGLALWMPFWLLRVLGAGDVKLVAGSGAWLGMAGIVEASLIAAALGGVLAIVALARKGGVAAGATRFGAWLVASRLTRSIVHEFTPKEHRIPYGLALAAGAVTAAWFPRLIW